MKDESPFPGVTNILKLFKARITRLPAGVPRARAGWVVWLAEVCPGLYLAQIPGTGVHYTEHSRTTWEPVSDDTLVMTLEEIRAEDRRRPAETGKWQPGQTVTTPGTRLAWGNLAEWITACASCSVGAIPAAVTPRKAGINAPCTWRCSLARLIRPFCMRFSTSCTAATSGRPRVCVTTIQPRSTSSRPTIACCSWVWHRTVATTSGPRCVGR